MTDDRWGYEGEAIRMHQANKRLFILSVILIIVLFVSNGAWIWYESQFKTITIEAEQQSDDDSTNYIIGGDYDAGETESQNN
jgi:hypothetical protein